MKTSEENKKYEFTGETMEFDSRILHRIRALVDIPRHSVEKGDLGGWIEKERNLRFTYDAWVSGNAMVYGNARVYGNAWVSGDAEVYGSAEVSGSAYIYGEAWISGTVMVHDNARVYGKAWVAGNAVVSGNARIYDAGVSGNARFSGNAEVYNDSHVLTVGPIGSRKDDITFARSKDGDILVVCGCYYGNIRDFMEKVKKRHAGTKHYQTYMAACNLAVLQIEDTNQAKLLKDIKKLED